MKNSGQAGSYIPLKFRESGEVLSLERDLRLCFVCHKWCDNEKLFIKERIPSFMRDEISYEERLDIPNSIVTEFDDFDEFYNYLNGNMEGVDFRGFNFDGVNLRVYNIADCVFDSAVLISNNLYDDSFHKKHVKSLSFLETLDFTVSEIILE
ncbi:MAG: hypothetical protein PHI41_10175 [Erysipelotrichaceae bacterium]|nr:hypothetical protein [Erysipelotrichaceae bacterium]